MENYTHSLDYGIIALFLVISAMEIFMICRRSKYSTNEFMGFSCFALLLGTVLFSVYAPSCRGLMSFILVFFSLAILTSLSVMVFVLGLIKAILYINYFYSKGMLRTEATAFAFIKAKYQRDFDLEESLIYQKKNGVGCYWVFDVGTYVAVSSAGTVKKEWKRDEMKPCQAGDIIALSKDYQAKLVVTKSGVFKLVPAWKF